MNSLGRTPKITRSALLPFICQKNIATGMLLVLGTKSKLRPGRPKAVRPPPYAVRLPLPKKPTRGSNLIFPSPDLPNHSTDCSETSRIARLPPGQPLPQRNRPESLTIERNRRNRLSRSRTRQTRKTTKSGPIQGRFGGKVISQRGTRSSYVTPNKNPKKSSSKLRQENHNKELQKSPQSRTGKALHHLEEPRRTIYTNHEDSYKV
jgi:hypothetical protein